MIRNDIYPFEWSTPRIKKGDMGGKGHSWQATQWDDILDENTGPRYEVEDLEENFVESNSSLFICFTGTIVKIDEAYVGFKTIKRFTILPCSWPRTAVIRSYFYPEDKPNEGSTYCDMLYKPFKVVGRINPGGSFADNFRVIQNPVPGSLQTGIGWKLEGWVLGWGLVPESRAELYRIRVSFDVPPNDLPDEELDHGGDIVYLIGDAWKLKEHVKFWFKGVMFPKYGNLDRVGMYARLLGEVEQLTA